ncbi:MAG: aspartyl beta-hydroxylase, partial [Lysobacteraceae bacterium]
MKLQVPFLQLPVMFDAPEMAREIAAIDPAAWRGRTQRDDGNSALTLITTGGDPDNDELAGPMRPTPWLARCPYLMQVLGSMGATWGRARLMRLSGQAEVKPHVDVNYYWRERMRVHFPV